MDNQVRRFITPSGSTGQPDGLFAGVALTGSALSFIAGFGVEGGFVARESLVRRVFNMPPPAENIDFLHLLRTAAHSSGASQHFQGGKSCLSLGAIIALNKGTRRRCANHLQ